MIDFSQLRSPKDFERLCADLLEAEAFHVDREPSVDVSGIDIVATCEYRAHSPTIRPVTLRWLVQCKHYATSGKNLGRQEMAEIIVNFKAFRTRRDALLIIVSTECSETAIISAQAAVAEMGDAEIEIWNFRKLVSLLEKHAHLLARYKIEQKSSASRFVVPPILPTDIDDPILIISDQSALAHDICSALRDAGLQVAFLPVWNYSNKIRLAKFMSSIHLTRFSLAMCFLGDSFHIPLPEELQQLLVDHSLRGRPLLLFPFVAWAAAQGELRILSKIVPVAIDRHPPSVETSLRNRTLKERFDELFDCSFEEDEYREFSAVRAAEQPASKPSRRFGISHSFEHIRPLTNSAVALSDILGVPLVVTATTRRGKIAYFNSCCHSCLAPDATASIASPFATSREFRTIFLMLVRWLLVDDKELDFDIDPTL
ncbi:restriction endonuclease [Bradyrhizobium oligotrophicum]|uniref:restriction endonuclease n=1 Tax=Bradyrhizobium oligotrophicum TaxID=44255 RepID=UPI003EBFF31F